MFSWFGPSLVSDIDQLTWDHAYRERTRTELEQLSNLFDIAYLKDLHKAMVAGLTRRHPNGVLLIKLAWIDKIPLAKWKGTRNRTELGDTVLFAIEQVGSAPSRKNVSARAVILQAKVTKAKGQQASPTIPINAMKNSTAREYKLLSSWPEFDLYKTSGSAVPLVTGVNLANGNSAPHPYGWYLAAPRLKDASHLQSIWPSWWMVGPPMQGARCTNTFGDFLSAFLQGEPLQNSHAILGVGEAFNCPIYPPAVTGLSGWDRVCAEIINIVETNSAPSTLFGNWSKRIRKLDDIPLQFMAFGPCPPEVNLSNARVATIEGIGPLDPEWIWSYVLWSRLYSDIPVPPNGTEDTEPEEGDRRIPILIFNSYIPDDEG